MKAMTVWLGGALCLLLPACESARSARSVAGCQGDCDFPPLPILAEQTPTGESSPSGTKIYVQTEGILTFPASQNTTTSLGKKRTLDDFEGYPEKAIEDELSETYTMNSGGEQVSLSLDRQTKEAGDFGLKYAYELEVADYCGVFRQLEDDWTGAEGLLFWMKPDGSQRTLTIQFRTRGTSGSVYWELYLTLSGTDPVVVKLPFGAFQNPPWYTPSPDEAAINVLPNVSYVEELALYINQSVGAKGASVLYFDSIGLY